MGWSNAGWLGDDSGWYLNKVVAGGATTTWDPANKSASLTLSNGNLTMAANAGGFVSGRGIASHSTGKFYYEAVVNVTGGTNTIGIANASSNLSNFCGADANGVGYTNNGSVIISGSAITTIQTFTTSNTIGIAVDIGSNLIWYRTNGGNWNNSGTANPATGVGGITMTGLAAGPYFPCGGTLTLNDQWTADFGATGYANAAPSGFGNW